MSKAYILKDVSNNKTLGIIQNINDDFKYSVTTVNDVIRFTKRKIISIISQIYDILGLLSPVIIKAKMIIQKLWLGKVDWDSALPKNILLEWLHFF